MGMSVLKMYQAGRHGGDNAELWEDCWAHHSFEEALRFCDSDPLRRLFERYVPPGSRVLEGGCGAGQYVVYYSNRGRRMIGLDFARDALARLRARRPDLPLCTANVEQLPLRSASFDAYYSGGVVEHLEHGPERALSEAARVLRDDGVLLCSVPFFNPVRQLLAGLRLTDGEPLRTTTVTHRRDGRVFWQYAFTRAEFERQLNRHGFEVVESMGYSILWGLYELPGVAALVNGARRVIRRRSGNESVNAEPPQRAGAASNASRQHSLISRLVVSEDVDTPVLGTLVRMLRGSASNMIMFVCVKRGPLSPPLLP